MTPFLWRMGGAVAVGFLGLTLVFWQLEHASLMAFAGEGRPGPGVYALLFAGLVLTGGAVLFGFTRWADFLRHHPDMAQLPPWLAITVIVVAGAFFVTGTAVHAGWMRQQDPIPMTISQGYVAYQVVFAALALVPLVLLAARWSPGYRER